MNSIKYTFSEDQIIAPPNIATFIDKIKKPIASFKSIFSSNQKIEKPILTNIILPYSVSQVSQMPYESTSQMPYESTSQMPYQITSEMPSQMPSIPDKPIIRQTSISNEKWFYIVLFFLFIGWMLYNKK